jgi:hypothetical protein
MDELGLQLAELAEEAADGARPAGAAAARRRGARRRRRQATGALVLVASMVAGLVWVDRRPLPSADATKGWKTFTDASSNLKFRYPPDWAVDRRPEGGDEVLLVPPEDAGRPPDKVRYLVTVGVGQSFWVGELWMGPTTARGRLPGGQPYLLDVEEPQVAPGQPATSDQAYGGGTYSIDWGRYCTSRGGRRPCGPHRVMVSFWSSSRSAWNRYRAVADAIAGSVTQLRPTGPSVGDRSRPACHADQWRLIWPEEQAFGNHQQRFVHQGGVRYRKGPPCHLRLTLRLALLDGTGRRLPVAGNPATTTVEGDLPEDQMQWLQGSWVIDGPFMWRFAWEEWCNKGLPAATLRVTAEGGATLTSPGPRLPRRGATKRPAALGDCRDRGRPSTLAGWPR